MDTTHQEQFRLFAFYNAWINKRLYSAAATLPDRERRLDRDAFFGSIQGTLNHILLADRIWLGRLSVAPVMSMTLRQADLVFEFESLGQELFAGFSALWSAREATDETISAWVEELTPPVLEAPMRYTNSKGESREQPTWQAVAHFFNHQTHHRGQVSVLLTQAGVDVGVTDLIAVTSLYNERRKD
jgi:uncharacterized damage-inducible protein DinB